MMVTTPETVALMLAKPPAYASPMRMAEWLERKSELFDRLADESTDPGAAQEARDIAWLARCDAQTQRRVSGRDGTRGLRPLSTSPEME
jgi:hypothetical protein